ncbi:anti-phage defense-associated sirtuin Dsr1 [Pseudoduganella sp. R-34]|uniref:anti-phage defense-associated sirtuin Dsr1 n=1 Tax=Pseudoduganella sp. R-34 TaxID=3404062 RepID=UPI003CF43428
MQFVVDGPDIPDELLQAHEEGRVVFFCGAGISYPAGLKDFKGLVTDIYKLNGAEFDKLEQVAFDNCRYDATLDLLERRLPGQRRDVRQALANALQPKLRRKGAIDTHAALLRLGRSREGVLRLVTTNFDRVFHAAGRRTGQAFHEYAAPMLPVPKASRWDGLVFLHGLLAQKIEDTDLNRLIVTSGDFGLAYLTERWAARFVSELFRNYVVCFVGYGINDPVLRYMMDALAADRLLGELTPQAWAFGECNPGQESQEKKEWEAKGVKPILFNPQAGSYPYAVLHQTLHAWGETYRDGVEGKEAIVVKHALAKPQDSTKSDDFVGRMLWALSDKSGLPAKRFAEFNPTPSLDWLLEAFAKDRFVHSDLVRFGVPARQDVDPKLTFSMVRRPAPYDRAPFMVLASGRVESSQWDDVMAYLARWLARHLNDVRLLIWIAERGGQMQDRWPFMVEYQLDHIASLEREGNVAALDEIRLHAPMAIPSPLMRTLWRLLLSGRVKSNWRDVDLYRWKLRLKREGLTTTLRLQLRELLAPQIALKRPYRWAEDQLSEDAIERISQIVDAEMVLAADDVHSTLCQSTEEHWVSALPLLLEDIQQLLRDALDLLRELGEADDLDDRSYWHLPSITPHWQNRGFKDWVSLIELLREAWIPIHKSDVQRAALIARTWFALPYPTFKRLALFAASQESCIPPDEWVTWLLTNDAWWLWTPHTGREVSRLFVLQGKHLTGAAKGRLEEAILEGPPREMYQEDLELERWQDIVARDVWLNLAILRSSGLALGAAAAVRFAELSEANPKWRLADNQRDEFSSWMSGTGDPDYEASRDIAVAPKMRRELVQWLPMPVPDKRPFYEDTWREVCRTRFFHSLAALCDLAHDDVWPTVRWREALQVWAEEGMLLRSWRFAAPLVRTMPDSVITEVIQAFTWWIEAASKSSHLHTEILLDLCTRILGLPLEPGEGAHVTRNGVQTYDPVGSAINHPVGHITQALINLWFRRQPNDNDLLPDDLAPLFTAMCDVNVVRFRHGRVLMGANLIAFFRVDANWTEQKLLPLFDWANPVESKAVWEGFLWSPRLYQPLLSAFKREFLETATRYGDLGEHSQQFAAFLTYAALGPTEGFTLEDFRKAIGAMPQAGLEHSAQALAQAMESAGEQREDYWRNRAKPFFVQVWPKSRELASTRISDSLARMAIAAGNAFPDALAAVKGWLKPMDHPHYLLRMLKESDLSSRYPKETLQLLKAVITEKEWAYQELAQCLEDIVNATPKLADDASYRRLREYSRKRAG